MRVDSQRIGLEVRRSRAPFALLLLLALAGMVTLGIILKNLPVERPWGDYYSVRAAFPGVKGVIPGQHEVRIAGVRVGIIQEAELVRGRPVLTVRIEAKHGRLYRDARMRLRPATALQDMYVQVEDRGTPQAGVAREQDILPVEQAVAPVDVSRVLQSFDEPTREHMAALLHGMGRGLRDRGQSLRAAFVELAPFLQATDRVAGALAERRRALRRLVHNFGRLTGALARRDEQLTSLIRRGEATLGELARNDRPLAATLAEVPPALATMRSSFASLRRLSGELDPALASLRPVASLLEPGLAALERFGSEAAPALTSLRPAVRRLRPLATSLPPTARQLDSAFARLEPQAEPLDRLTAMLAVCRGSVQKFLSWGMLSTFKFYNADIAVGRAGFGIDLNTSGSEIDPVQRRRIRNCSNGGEPLAAPARRP